MKQGIHLRLVSPEERRVRRIAQEQGVDLNAARAKMREIERGRARLVSRHFRADVADPHHYDAVWNGARVDFDEIARWTADRVGQFARTQAPSQRAASSA